MKRMNKIEVCIYIDVSSIDEFLKKIVQAGGKALAKKTPIPGVGYSAYCKDTEGNTIGIFQSDPKAK